MWDTLTIDFRTNNQAVKLILTFSCNLRSPVYILLYWHRFDKFLLEKSSIHNMFAKVGCLYLDTNNCDFSLITLFLICAIMAPVDTSDYNQAFFIVSLFIAVMMTILR